MRFVDERRWVFVCSWAEEGEPGLPAAWLDRQRFGFINPDKAQGGTVFPQLKYPVCVWYLFRFRNLIQGWNGTFRLTFLMWGL